jgi:hypothetical protein
MTTTARLSLPQRWILRNLLKYTEAVPAKSFARLERRGLIVRTNQTSGMRTGPNRRRIRTSLEEPFAGCTDHVILTDLGAETAKGLT